MLNIFEKPWALLGLSILVLFTVLTIRSFLPDKKRFWQWLPPLLIVFLAFGLDALVNTDREKINNVTGRLISGIENENSQIIRTYIDEDYSDSYHQSKDSLIARSEQILSKYKIKKIKQTGILLNISGKNAKATIFFWVYFDQDSYIAQNYKSSLHVKAEIYYKKQSDDNWFVNRTEVLEIDKQRFRWANIR